MTEAVERRHRVLNALANSEAKCASLMILDQKRGRGKEKLRTDFMDLTGHVWIPGNRTIFAYCEDSFIPNGLAAKSFRNQVVLSQEGETYGQPVAAHLIYQSAYEEHTLNRIFGRTMGGDRSQGVVTRADLLTYLTSQPICRISDIKIFPNIRHHVISQSARHLAKLGYVLFFPGGNHEVRAIPNFKLNADYNNEVKPVDKFSRLTFKILEFVRNGFTDTLSIANTLRPDYPNYTPAVSDQDSLVQDIDTVIRGLLNQGVILPEVVMDKETAVEITDKGREFVERVLKPIDAVCSGNLALSERLRRLPWQEVAPKVVERYTRSSNYISSHNINPNPGVD